MSHTFLEVVNLALREVNEVPLTEAQFTTTRGLQQFAKEAVNRSFYDISNVSTKWDWLHAGVSASPHTEIREIKDGVQWYDIQPTDTTRDRLEIDWNTFLVTDKNLVFDDGSEPTVVKNLPMITYDEWIAKYRERDFANMNKGEPEFVIRHPSANYGITPVPDKSYWVEYNVANNAEAFVNANDVIPIPHTYLNVLLARAKYYLWLFRENDTQANFSLGEYREGLNNMKRVLLSNKEEGMRAI